MEQIEEFVIRYSEKSLQERGYSDSFQSMKSSWAKSINTPWAKIEPLYQLAESLYNNILCNRWQDEYTFGKSVAFFTYKFPSLVRNASHHMRVMQLGGGIKGSLNAFRNLTPQLHISGLHGYLNNYALSGDSRHLHELVDDISSKLSKQELDYIVFPNDSLPIERAYIYSCRELGIQTINIQDGIYQLCSNPLHGRAADYVFVWGEAFKEWYLKHHIGHNDNIFILGYPYRKVRCKTTPKTDNEVVICYLGQCFELYNKALLKDKIHTIKEIGLMCQELQVPFIYRPHPGDNVELLHKLLPNIVFSPKNESLQRTLQRGTIFISFNSTTLIEAAMISKMTIQLRNYPLDTDNFEDLEVCSRSIDNLDDLRTCLTSVVKGQVHESEQFLFNRNYIDIDRDPNQRFLEILGSI